MKRAGTLLIAAVLLLTLCACKRETRPAVGLGTFHGEQVSVYGGDWQPIGEVYSGQTYLTLNAGGEGVFCVDGEAAAVEWETSGGRLTLTMGSARCEGTIDANTVTIGFFDADIRMSFSRTASAALPLLDSLPEQAQEPDADAEPDHAAYWAGDWYGWHIVTDASEELQYLKDTAWDACAHISVRGDAGMLTVWDTENEPGELLLRASVTFSAGTTDAGHMTADSGTYLDCDLTNGLSCDPGVSEVHTFDHMICISGRAEDENGGWVRFRLYLRPGHGLGGCAHRRHERLSVPQYAPARLRQLVRAVACAGRCRYAGLIRDGEIRKENRPWRFVPIAEVKSRKQRNSVRNAAQS